MLNLKAAVRSLGKHPLVSLVAILSLALGIGANAAIFSLFEELVLRPLPVADAARLVNLTAPGPKQGSVSCNGSGDCDAVFSHPMFRDLQGAEPMPFEGIAAHYHQAANIGLGDETIRGTVNFVSGSYFPVLNLAAHAGRLLSPSDDETAGSHPVAVVSHDFWTGRLASDPSIIGRSITLNGLPHTVVGVAPRGFRGNTIGVRPEVYAPLSMRGAVDPGYAGYDDRLVHSTYLFARLSPGVTREQAEADLGAAYRRILDEVEVPLQTGMTAETLERFRTKEIVLENGRRGRGNIRQEAAAPLALLLAVTGVVLLLACANIANLLLARSAGRREEMAIRGALGARRSHILSQLLAEALVLAVLGGTVSLLIGDWTLSFLAADLPPEALRALDWELDSSVVVFAAVLAVGAGLLSGAYPALLGSRTGAGALLRSGSGHASEGRAARRFQSGLVTAQIALCTALLVNAGLFVRSLVNVSRVDLGIETDGVITFRVSPERSGYDGDEARIVFEELEAELSALPGVSSVSAARVPVLAGSLSRTSVSVEGYEPAPDETTFTDVNWLGVGYFRTLRVPLLAGREFTAADGSGASPVAIVNQAFVNRYLPGESDVLGRHVDVGRSPDVEIVGLAPDTKYQGVRQEVDPTAYLPYRQLERPDALTFYARVSEPASALAAVRPLVGRLDPDLPVEELKTLERQVQETLVAERVLGRFSGAFALLATVLATIGLYGVLAYAVERRTREIGVRIALGAGKSRIRRLVLGRVALQMLAGSVVGMVLALVAAQGVGSLLFGVESIDPISMLLAVALLGAVALTAGYLPARRAVRVQPVETLRWE